MNKKNRIKKILLIILLLLILKNIVYSEYKANRIGILEIRSNSLSKEDVKKVIDYMQNYLRESSIFEAAGVRKVKAAKYTTLLPSEIKFDYLPVILETGKTLKAKYVIQGDLNKVKDDYILKLTCVDINDEKIFKEVKNKVGTIKKFDILTKRNLDEMFNGNLVPLKCDRARELFQLGISFELLGLGMGGFSVDYFVFPFLDIKLTLGYAGSLTINYHSSNFLLGVGVSGIPIPAFFGYNKFQMGVVGLNFGYYHIFDNGCFLSFGMNVAYGWGKSGIPFYLYKNERNYNNENDDDNYYEALILSPFFVFGYRFEL